MGVVGLVHGAQLHWFDFSGFGTGEWMLGVLVVWRMGELKLNGSVESIVEHG